MVRNRWMFAGSAKLLGREYIAFFKGPNEPSADMCWEWSCFIFFQSGPKTLNSIQPVNFISDFWLRIEDIFPHTPPSSLKSLSGSSTVGQPCFFPRRCCCFFFWAQKKQPTKVAFFFQQSWRFQDLKIFSGLEVYPFYKFYKTTYVEGDTNFKLKFRTY